MTALATIGDPRLTRTERRLVEQAEIDRLKRQVKLAPRGQIIAWRKKQIRAVAEMLRRAA